MQIIAGALDDGSRRHRPRQWGACWLALVLWDRLELDRFWCPRLPASRQGTRWLDVLKTQVCYQLIEPGSEWRLHRHWYEHSAMADLLGGPRVPSTYFESDAPFDGLRQHGYSRDRRSDCVQVVIALIVTPQGFPLAYEVMPGNTGEKTTLADFLTRISGAGRTS